MSLLLNFVVLGLLAGVVSAAAVDLVAIRRPRLAAFTGTLVFPLVALAPFFAARGQIAIAVDDRRLDLLAAIVCAVVAAALLAREVVSHAVGAARRRLWKRASPRLRAAAGVDSILIGPGCSPATVGLLRQCIVLPGEDVDPAIIRHEVAHYRRHDAATHAVRRLLRAGLWFHPGLHLLDRSIRLAAELSADVSAVASADEAGRQAFAQMLLTTARDASPGSAFGFSKAKDLELRIRAILGCTNRRRAVALSTVLLLALSLLHFAPHFEEGEEVIVREVIRIR